MATTQKSKATQTQLNLADQTACVVMGGSSLTTLNPDGQVHKHPFYPTSLEEYIQGIVQASIQNGKLIKDKKGVLVIASPGAFQNEGTIASLPPNFHRVTSDAQQRGVPNLFFRQLIEEELTKQGYNQVKAFGYNDAVPALTALLSQENTDEVLKDFEKTAGLSSRAEYSINYMINGTGTGEASILPDSSKIITAEKGHLKPDLLWYELNPFYKFITRFPIVGQNRSIERLIAGGPDRREARHFTKILNAVLDVLNEANHPEANSLAQVLGFANHSELVQADGPNGILKVKISTEKASGLVELGQCIKAGSKLALELRNVFAKALGSSFAYMHFAIGEMPDAPLNTFIGPADVRRFALGFVRSDGSTTALFAKDQSAWDLIEKSAIDYAKYINADRPHCFKVLNINTTFPNIHPDFGGLPVLAEKKLNNLV